MLPYLTRFSFFIFFTILCQTTIHGETIEDDVKAIKIQSSPSVLRCVLNGTPRALAIQLSDRVALGYDTWHGGVFVIWKPKENAHFLKLVGAVYTGAHGPQPQTNGKIIFQEKTNQNNKRYQHSNNKSTLHYLGHHVEKNGIVTLSFSFRNSEGAKVGLIQDSCSIGKNGLLERNITVSGLAKGTAIAVQFPKGIEWSGLANNVAILESNNKFTYSSKLP